MFEALHVALSGSGVFIINELIVEVFTETCSKT